jgi:hypothetical protein
MPPTLCGKAAPCLKRGLNQRRSAPRTVGQAITSRCIWIIRSSRGSRCVRRWDAARPPEGLGENPINARLRADRRRMTYARKANPRRFWPTGANVWMKNGGRCHARWLPKDHAIKTKPKARHHSRSFSRQQLPSAVPIKRIAQLGAAPGAIPCER